MPAPLPKIFIFTSGLYNDGPDQDWVSTALAEDGEYITGHMSSSLDFARLDMGLTSSKKHSFYKGKYPTGFDLIDVLGLKPAEAEAHPELGPVLIKNWTTAHAGHHNEAVCPCGGTAEQRVCALTGCGFCTAAQASKRAQP